MKIVRFPHTGLLVRDINDGSRLSSFTGGQILNLLNINGMFVLARYPQEVIELIETGIIPALDRRLLNDMNYDLLNYSID